MQMVSLLIGLCVCCLAALGCAVTEPDDRDTARVRAAVAGGGAVSIPDLASDLGISEAAVVAALPERMRVELPDDDLPALFESLGTLAPIEVRYRGSSPGSSLSLETPLLVADFTPDRLLLSSDGGSVEIDINPADLVFLWMIRKPIEGGAVQAVGFYDSAGDRVMTWEVADEPGASRAFEVLWDRYSE